MALTVLQLSQELRLGQQRDGGSLLVVNIIVVAILP